MKREQKHLCIPGIVGRGDGSTEEGIPGIHDHLDIRRKN